MTYNDDRPEVRFTLTGTVRSNSLWNDAAINSLHGGAKSVSSSPANVNEATDALTLQLLIRSAALLRNTKSELPPEVILRADHKNLSNADSKNPI